MNIIFMGTPEFGVKTIIELLNYNHNVILAVTQPPCKQGRGMKVTKSAIHAKAGELGIPVITPDNIKDPGVLKYMSDLKPDVCVVAAYGKILPSAILNLPRYGCINVHGSYLPRWRGASPIQSAILANDQTTGVTIIKMTKKMDAGPMLLAELVPIDDSINYGALEERLSAIAPQLVIRTLAALERGSLVETPQADEDATYCKKISRSDPELDWRQNALDIHCKIRAFSPAPCCFSHLLVNGEKLRVKIISASMIDETPPQGAIGNIVGQNKVICKTGMIALGEIQLPGRKKMNACEAFRGLRSEQTLRFIAADTIAAG